MKKFIYAYILMVGLCFSSSIFAQNIANPLTKERIDSKFTQYMQANGLSYNNAYYQVLTDSLAVISCDATGLNGYGVTVTHPIAYFYIIYHHNGEEYFWQDKHYLNPSSTLFSTLENPYFPKSQMTSNESSLFSVMTYEDALYYKYMYHIGLKTLKGPQWMSVEERKSFLNSWFQTIKTGFWIRKNELDAFGDPICVSLSCPFYAKRMVEGVDVAENIEFYLNITKDKIRFIPNKLEKFWTWYKYTLTTKDSAGNQQTYSLDENLCIVSNTSSFLRLLKQGDIFKCSIHANDKEKTNYVFTIIPRGFDVAMKCSKLSTAGITDKETTVNHKETAVNSAEELTYKDVSGTYEFRDKLGKVYHLILKEDKTALLQDFGERNKTYYCSYFLSAFKPNAITIKFSDEIPIITYEGGKGNAFYQYLVLYDGWIYKDESTRDANNPNWRLKATKIK